MNEQAVFDALRYRIVVDMRGTRWYYNAANQLHRDGGPAIEHACGANGWYQNGLRHRTDGPAIIWANGKMEWWINGVRLTEAEFNQAVKVLGD